MHVVAKAATVSPEKGFVGPLHVAITREDGQLPEVLGGRLVIFVGSTSEPGPLLHLARTAATHHVHAAVGLSQQVFQALLKARLLPPEDRRHRGLARREGCQQQEGFGRVGRSLPADGGQETVDQFHRFNDFLFVHVGVLKLLDEGRQMHVHQAGGANHLQDFADALAVEVAVRRFAEEFQDVDDDVVRKVLGVQELFKLFKAAGNPQRHLHRVSETQDFLQLKCVFSERRDAPAAVQTAPSSRHQQLSSVVPTGVWKAACSLVSLSFVLVQRPAAWLSGCTATGPESLR